MSKTEVLPPASYQALAEFRYRIRYFMSFSERSTKDVDLEPQQHQLLLAVKGLPAGLRPTIRTLADRLLLRHHSTVELVDRLVQRGLVARQQNKNDRREVLIRITRRGEHVLRKLSLAHLQELRITGPRLVDALRLLIPLGPETGTATDR